MQGSKEKEEPSEPTISLKQERTKPSTAYTSTAAASAAAARNTPRPIRKKRYSSIHNKRFAQMDSIKSHYALVGTNSYSPAKSSSRAQHRAAEREVHTDSKPTGDGDTEDFVPVTPPSKSGQTVGVLPTSAKRIVKTGMSSAPKRRRTDATGRMVELKSSGSRMNLHEATKPVPSKTLTPSIQRTESRAGLTRTPSVARHRPEDSMKKMPSSRSISHLAASQSSSMKSGSSLAMRSGSSLATNRPSANGPNTLEKREKPTINTSIPNNTKKTLTPTKQLSRSQSVLRHHLPASSNHQGPARPVSSLDFARPVSMVSSASSRSIRGLVDNSSSTLKSRIPRSTSISSFRKPEPMTDPSSQPRAVSASARLERAQMIGQSSPNLRRLVKPPSEGSERGGTKDSRTGKSASTLA